MQKKPKILITNDDGIFAPGLKYLAAALVDVQIFTSLRQQRKNRVSGWELPFENRFKFFHRVGENSCSTSGYRNARRLCPPEHQCAHGLSPRPDRLRH